MLSAPAGTGETAYKTAMKILVIEDDPAILRGLAESLRRESYEVLTASDGEAGYNMLEKRPDLLVLDLMLPKLSGYEICRRMRAEDCTTPILMLTARCEEGDRVLGLELGADDYVTKPFSRAAHSTLPLIFRTTAALPYGCRLKMSPTTTS